MDHSSYINKWLSEAITFSPRIRKGAYDSYREYDVPLKDSDVIRVYHGFYDPYISMQFCLHGASGKEFADRVYSFESDNNPYGIFVSADLQTAKSFSRSVDEIAIIIEFHAKVSDLEAPVWPDGNYTVQGGMSSYWKGNSTKDKMNSREIGRLASRKNAIQKADQKNIEFVKLSDRPELAQSLFMSSEYQALFTGDLNPNMIRYIWVAEGNIDAKYNTFKRLTRKEFIKKYYNKLKIKYSPTSYAMNRNDKKDKLYLPNENWGGFDDFLNRFVKKHKYDLNIDSIKQDFYRDIKRGSNGISHWIDTFEKGMWPRQLKQAIQDLKLDSDDDLFVP
jgi:hypothetical protein